MTRKQIIGNTILVLWSLSMIAGAVLIFPHVVPDLFLVFIMIWVGIIFIGRYAIEQFINYVWRAQDD